jgi:D-threonate/D-erythronate kinase
MIAVVADDITGAAEIAGICLRYRLSVLLGVDEWPTGNAQVKIVATNTRSETEEGAILIHRQITRRLLQENPDFIFKKCDSVLRGHVLAELSALLSETGKDSVVLQPSNPAAGRIISNRHYYVNAIPLHETPFAHDPDFPARNSYIDDLLHCNPDFLNLKFHISDCASVEQLKHIALSSATDKLAAGSSAFFEQMLLVLFVSAKEDCVRMNIPVSGNTLLINGSTHLQSTSFVESCNNKLMVRCFGVSEQKDPAVFFNEIYRLIQSGKASQILVTGGATAWYMLKHPGIGALVPFKEFAPGVVGMKTQIGNEISIVMKPGSYAWPIEI